MSIFELTDKTKYNSPWSDNWANNLLEDKSKVIVPFILMKTPNLDKLKINLKTLLEFCVIGYSEKKYFDVKLINDNKNLEFSETKWTGFNGYTLKTDITIKKGDKYNLKFLIDNKYTSTIEFNNFICFCDRSFQNDEFKDIIIELRKKNKDLAYIGESLFNIGRGEPIQNPTWEIFTKNINSTFSKFGINSCIAKIHFIAQTFHESMHYRTTYEGKPTDTKAHGGELFIGRGLIQTTHDYNYLDYFDNYFNSNLFLDYIKTHKKYDNFLDFISKNENPVLQTVYEKEFLPFIKRLSQEMTFVCDSSGWYWDKNNINKDAENDDVFGVSKKINGINKNTSKPNHLEERTKYTEQLKDIMHLKECTNK